MAGVHFSGRKSVEKVGKSAAVPCASSRPGGGKQARKGQERPRGGAGPQGLAGQSPRGGAGPRGLAGQSHKQHHRTWGAGDHCRGLTVSLEKAQG